MHFIYRHRKLIILGLLFSCVFRTARSNTNDTGITVNPCDGSDDISLCRETTQIPEVASDSNSTEYTFHDNGVDASDSSYLWKVLDYVQVTILFIGLFSNLITVYLLARLKGHIPPVASVLMIHQALMDALVCLFMIPTFLVPAFWTSGNFHTDTFLCHVWHSQVLYWWALLMSVWTLVLMSIDRFLAIRFPLKYNLVRPKYFLRALIGIYIVMFLVALPAVFEFSYNPESKECTSDFYSVSPIFVNFISTYGFIWFATAYAIPVPLLFLFYGIILSTLRKRMKNTKLGESTVIINANTQATKTFGYVTAFFIFSFSFDSWYYLLYTVGAVSYVYHSPIQVISVFMTALNSCVNPFIYAASMAFMRRALLEMFGCKKATSGGKQQSSSSSVSTITAAKDRGLSESQSTVLSA